MLVEFGTAGGEDREGNEGGRRAEDLSAGGSVSGMISKIGLRSGDSSRDSCPSMAEGVGVPPSSLGNASTGGIASSAFSSDFGKGSKGKRGLGLTAWGLNSCTETFIYACSRA